MRHSYPHRIAQKMPSSGLESISYTHALICNHKAIGNTASTHRISYK